MSGSKRVRVGVDVGGTFTDLVLVDGDSLATAKIPTTETQTNASWGAAVMASGAGSVGQAMDDIVARSSPNSDILQALGLIA